MTMYSTKDLKGGYNSNNFSLLNVYLDEKEPSVKIQPPNIFKDHHIVAQPKPTTVGYDEWPLSIARWRKFCNSHGKYKAELNFVIPVKFCHVLCYKCTWYFLATPQSSNLLVRSVYRFHVYFHVGLILHELGVS